FQAFELDALQFAAVFPAAFLARVFNQDAAHGLSRGAEEMRAILPLVARAADEPEKSFMNQSGRLQRLAGGLLDHLRGGQTTQFVVYQREQFLSGSRVALLGAVEDACDLAHIATITRFRSEKEVGNERCQRIQTSQTSPKWTCGSWRTHGPSPRRSARPG